MLEHNNCLTSLSLAGNGIAGLGQLAIAEMTCSLSELLAGHQLVDALGKIKNHVLRVLDLSENGLGASTASSFLAAYCCAFLSVWQRACRLGA